MYTTAWQFKTAEFTVLFQFAECEENPRDHFEFDEDVTAVLNGDVHWFDARVVVYHGENIIGSDYLGCCAYSDIEEFVTGHRDADPMNRNCTIMRKAKGNVIMCHYFPDMVRTAIGDARSVIERFKQIQTRNSE